MGRRGPKSTAEASTPLRVISVDHLRLKPPPYLTGAARTVFEEIVSCSDPKHFRKNELGVLVAYCEALVLSRHYAASLADERSEGFDLSHRHWLEATKLVATLATRLRLTPHSRIDARAAGRMRTPMKLPWEFSGDE
jgi:phage terminase small subunit